MILGVVSARRGQRCSICGFDLARHRSRAAEYVGFAAGYLPLTERMRVREYLRLYGQLYGLADPNPRIDEGLERFRITHLADAMGTELSSGQRTLIGIVRADVAPAAAARARRADRVARSRCRAPRPRRACSSSAIERRHRAVDDESRHERRRAGVRTRACSSRTAASSPTARPRRSPSSTATATSKACSSISPATASRRRPSRGIIREQPGADRRPVSTSRRRGGRGRSRMKPPPSRDGAWKSWLRMRAIARRHAYVLVRSPHRLFDVTLWPLVDVVLFGSLAAFVGTDGASPRGEGVGLPARRHRALARHLPVADRDEHRLPRRDVDPQPAEPHGHAGARGRVRRAVSRCSAW